MATQDNTSGDKTRQEKTAQIRQHNKRQDKIANKTRQHKTKQDEIMQR
jgi:hypothetical protein